MRDPANEDEHRTKPGIGPRAISRVLRLFTTLAGRPAGMTLSQLSHALDVPKSTFLNTLRPLVSERFLIVDGTLYRLGPAAFRHAAKIMSAFSASDMIQTYVRLLAERTHESVGFGIGDWELGRAIYIEAVESKRPVLYAMRAGVSAPFYASAAGRVLLAYAPAHLRDGYLDRKSFRRLTSNTETDPGALREQLDTIRDQGYCLNFGELLEDTAAIAAPVFAGDNSLLGALMIGAPIERMRSNFDDFLFELIEVSRHASGIEAPR